MPQAAFTFQQIVSSREWAIGGSPDDVFASLELLNNAQSKNLVTARLRKLASTANHFSVI